MRETVVDTILLTVSVEKAFMCSNTIRFSILKEQLFQRDTLKLQNSLSGLSVE
jgi:hypothetical protein